MSNNRYRGLCSTCEGRAACTYPHYEDRPTLFCEEFDWAWQHRMETAAAITHPVRKAEVWSADVPRRASKYKGLCATCDNQETCTFPKAVGGVWHCEEFE